MHDLKSNRKLGKMSMWFESRAKQLKRKNSNEN